jgi:hypothetical protein
MVLAHSYSSVLTTRVPNAKAAREWIKHDLHVSGVTGKDPDWDAEIIEAILDQWKSLSRCAGTLLAFETKWDRVFPPAEEECELPSSVPPSERPGWVETK